MSNSAMKPPKHITMNGPMLLSQFSKRRSFLASGARARIHRRKRRESRPDHAQIRIVIIERDPHRDPLHDLGEIAGGVLRRNYAEDGAGCRGQAQEVTMKDMAGESVGGDCRRLPSLYSCELILLEIGIDPQTLRRHDRQQISALRDVGSDPRRAIADIAVNRSTDFRVADIEPRSVEIGPRLRHSA